MNIQEFREKYPEYEKYSDDVLAEAVYQKNYSMKDKTAFMSAFMGADEPQIDLSITDDSQMAETPEVETPFQKPEDQVETPVEAEVPETTAIPDESAGSFELDAIAQQEQAPEEAKEEVGRVEDFGSRVKQGFVGGGGGILKGTATIAPLVERQQQLLKGISPVSVLFRSMKRAITGQSREDELAEIREIAKDVPQETGMEVIKNSNVYKAGRKLIDYSNKEYKTNPEYDELFLSKVAQGAGSMGVFMAATLVNPVAGAFAGATMNADAQFEDAIRNGADFQTAMKAAQVGTAWGMTEVAPIEFAFSRLDKATGGWFTKNITEKLKSNLAKVGVEGLVGGIGEAIQEGFMEFANNWSARDLVGYDKERNLWDGVEESGEVGGVLGFLLTTLTSAFGVKRRGKEVGIVEDVPTDTTGMDELDLEAGSRTEDLPILEQTVAEIVNRRTHDQMMQSPAYKKAYDASDLGELSEDEETRQQNARDSFIRMSVKRDKWKKVVDKGEEVQGEEIDDQPAVGIEEAEEIRQEFEDDKEASETPLPDGYDPEVVMTTNIKGDKTEFSIGDAATIVEKYDASEKEEVKSGGVTITRDMRDQLSEQIDIYNQDFDADETIDSPRSEERESREVKLPPTTVWMHPKNLVLKPKTFQYKSDTDTKTGRNRTLKKLKKWSTAKAGVITGWQDINGTVFVGDGHQRMNALLAQQAEGKELDTKMLIQIYKEEDGYSARDVRALASGVNIAQGSGTAIDAAKMLRDLPEGELEAEMAELPPNSSLVRDAKGLAKLGEEAFDIVVNEATEPKYGSMVGEAFEESEQLAAMQILIKSKPASFAEGYAMIADIQAGGFVKSEQGGLFGEQEMESLIKERAQILSSAETGLKKNIRTFNALIKEEKKITTAGENVLDTETNKEIVEEARSLMEVALKTINTNPELNDALNEVSRQYKAGTITRNQAAKQFVEDATAYTERRSAERDAESGDKKPKDAKKKTVKKKATKKKAKKKASQITIEEEVEVEGTGEKLKVSENAAQAFLKLDKRIEVLLKIKDCVKA